MKKILVSDLTMRECHRVCEPSFKEKIEMVRTLEQTGVDVLEVARFGGGKAEELFLHSVIPFMKDTVLSCPVGNDEASVEAAYAAIAGAAHPRLHVMLPTSTVQMEYMSHKKPAAMLELADKLCRKAASLCADVEFSALDATRSDPAFLASVLRTVIAAGVTTVTVCDTVGTMLPHEAEEFVASLIREIPELANVTLGVEFSAESGLGVALAVSAIRAGATQVKCAVGIKAYPALEEFAAVLRAKSDVLSVSSALSHVGLGHACRRVEGILSPAAIAAEKTPLSIPAEVEPFVLHGDDEMGTVALCIKKLGYELNDEDVAKVYENFKRLSDKKEISAKELEAIIATSAMECVPVYKLKNYAISTGNLLSATAHICLEKDGEAFEKVSLGKGPIDAAFVAIEKVVGHHYELDDFQIRSVTEGREAMGEAIVKLRHEGKLYSGRGLSTDIIGSSIRAYINALNKICAAEV